MSPATLSKMPRPERVAFIRGLLGRFFGPECKVEAEGDGAKAVLLLGDDIHLARFPGDMTAEGAEELVEGMGGA